MRRFLNIILVFIIFCIVFSCQKEKSFELGQPAKGALQDSSGNCLPKSVSGIYIAGRALNDTNSIDVTLVVAITGPYSIVTDTVNGYSFRGSGSFASTGQVTVHLKGTGKPGTAGTDYLTVRFDSSSCAVPVTVLPSSTNTGPAVYSLQGSGGSCMNSILSGNYVKGVSLGLDNKVDIQVNVTTAGSYAITTNTVDGFSFSGSGLFATTGIQTVTLTGTGTPVSEGSNTFTVTAGTDTCTFAVSVAATAPPPGASTDHFPLTGSSWWSYEDPTSPGDTIKRVNSSTATFAGNTYRMFVDTNNSQPLDTFYFRRSSNDYYEYGPVDEYSVVVAFDNAPKGDILFLKEGLSTNTTWNSAEYSGTVSGQSVKLRYIFTCTNANASVTVNGKSFTNVYIVTLKPQISVLASPYQDEGSLWTFYYAKGIGLIDEKATDGTNTFELQVRNWLVF